MTSNWCKGGEHAGCQIHGMMKHPNGKKFRCKCSCHPAKRQPKRRQDEDGDVEHE